MADVFRPFRPQSFKVLVTRGDALASLRACPWLSYLAPLALGDLVHRSGVALGHFCTRVAPFALGDLLSIVAALGHFCTRVAPPLALGTCWHRSGIGAW